MQRAGNARQCDDPRPVPSGRVTFLFTDIEGSTRRWESDSQAMRGAVARHDELLRSVMSRHNGHVFKTVGDAFCVVFAGAEDALQAAAEAQRAIAGEDFGSVGGLGVRMALHTGFADERDGDYFGQSVNRVARLMSAGHGGQVLLSAATRELVTGQVPAGVALVDLGLHQLKDLTQLEHVWQLRIDGLPWEFAPLRSEGGAPNNLPAEVSNLIGREGDTNAVNSMLDDHRLVTLTGAGGVGKTRLAIHVAESALRIYPDGVWFADLAPIQDGTLVPSVIAKVLGIAQQEARRIDDALVQWLKRKRLLLLVDNCEHVIDAAASLAAAILSACPDVRILATSRQALRVTGEAAYKLPSLATPERVEGLSADAALGYGAIKLFVDRAKAIDPGFSVSDATAPVVAEICRRLDGIPLAIELAAARVKILSLATLASKLDERFRILTGGSRAALPRQQTLRALFDWSHELLDRDEQALFKRLAVFAGGFNLDGATAVCAGEAVAEEAVFDLLASLVDKSLVVADIDAGLERYGLLESAREFAWSKVATGDERDDLSRRHAQFFHGMAQAADEAAGGMSRQAMLAALEPDLDNFRAALEWSIRQRRDVLLGAGIAGALEQLWYASGLSTEGRAWIDAALEGVDEAQHPSIAARLWLARSLLFSGKKKFECAQRAKRLYAATGDALGVARAERTIGRSLLQMGRLDEAAQAGEQALPVLEAHGDRVGAALCRNVLADVAGERGDVQTARATYAQTLRAFEDLGDQAGKAVVFIDLAELAFREHDAAEALRHAQAALEIESRGKNATNLATAYSNVAAYHIALDDLDSAAEAASSALSWAQGVQSKSKLAWTLQHCALIAAMRGDIRAAGRLLGYVDAQYAELGLERESTERWAHERLAALLRERLSQPEMAACAAEGAQMTEERAIDDALRESERIERAATSR
jgi:predicted ATPase/class 3 adenylate cyclase